MNDQKNHLMANDTFVNREEPKNKRRSILISAFIELIIIVLLFLPLLKFPVPPPGQEGIFINFGEPSQGGGEPAEVPAETQPEEAIPEEKPQKEQPAPTEKASKKEKPTEKKVLTTEEPEPSPVKPKPDPTPEVKENPVDAQKVAQQTAAKEVPTFPKRNTKSNTEPSDKTGPNPPGPISSSNKKESGSGVVGEGLTGRTTTARPAITENFQEAGTVVVRVCVDAAGNVTEATFRLKGSIGNSSQLVRLAEENARKWKFGPGEDNQCGTIIYTFKLN